MDENNNRPQFNITSVDMLVGLYIDEIVKGVSIIATSSKFIKKMLVWYMFFLAFGLPIILIAWNIKLKSDEERQAQELLLFQQSIRQRREEYEE